MRNLNLESNQSISLSEINKLRQENAKLTKELYKAQQIIRLHDAYLKILERTVK